MNILIMGIIVSVTLHSTKDVNHTLYGSHLMLRIFKSEFHNVLKRINRFYEFLIQS